MVNRRSKCLYIIQKKFIAIYNKNLWKSGDDSWMISLFKKSCAICKAKEDAMLKFENRSGIRIVLCDSCKTYAEKRSFKVIQSEKKFHNLVAR